jgi:hypothetical protein
MGVDSTERRRRTKATRRRTVNGVAGLSNIVKKREGAATATQLGAKIKRKVTKVNP